MLLANILLEVITVWSEGQLANLVTSDIPVIFCQLFLKTRNGQHKNGSLHNSVERTAHCPSSRVYLKTTMAIIASGSCPQLIDKGMGISDATCG
jgi:hypothetical protein